VIENDEKLTVLIEEYKIIRKSIQDRTATNEKVMGLSLSALTIIFSIGYLENINEIFFIIPLLILWFYSYSIYIYSEVFVIAGYVTTLEKKINDICLDKCIKYETYIAPIIYHKYANIPFQGIAVLVSIIALIMCFSKIFDFSIIIFFIYLYLFFIVLIFVVIGNIIMFQHRRKAINKANEIDQLSHNSGV
jgi:hypothetical protein